MLQKGWFIVDVLMRAYVRRTDINLLVKLVEGLGHLGLITTLEKEEGLILIQTTEDCCDELLGLMQRMPVVWEIADDRLREENI